MLLQSKISETGLSAEDIRRVTLSTHEACLRIIDKRGPLSNPADRDHCVQYMVAIPLIFARLGAADYEDAVASDPRIDALRDKIECMENPLFTADYLDPEKRSVANSVRIEMEDGRLFEHTVEYPLGHRRRRAEGIPLLEAKFRRHLHRRFTEEEQRHILTNTGTRDVLEPMSVPAFVDLFVTDDPFPTKHTSVNI